MVEQLINYAELAELRRTHFTAEELAELVASGDCPVNERGDPHAHLAACLVSYVASEIEPHIGGGEELDAQQLINDVADLVGVMMLIYTKRRRSFRPTRP